MKTLKLLSKYLFLFAVGGIIYYNIEILWRGYSHWTMFVLGGIAFLFCGIINEFTAWEYPLWKQVLRADAFVVVAEFITGCIVNLWLGWNVWDYSNLPLNLLGQSCPQFALLFAPLCLIAIILDDYLRYWFFKEEKPRYQLF